MWSNFSPQVVKTKFLPQADHCEFYDGENDRGTDFSPCTSIFTCQFFTTRDPYPPSSARCSF